MSRETFPRGRRITRDIYKVLCKLCGQTYAWQTSLGNRRCPHCKRVVPVDERPLLPGEERRAREMVERETR